MAFLFLGSVSNFVLPEAVSNFTRFWKEVFSGVHEPRLGSIGPKEFSRRLFSIAFGRGNLSRKCFAGFDDLGPVSLKEGKRNQVRFYRLLASDLVIADGYTITVLDSACSAQISIQGIDAPEKNQAFGITSKDHLADKIAGKDVVIQSSKKDRHGRIHARPTTNQG